MSSHSTLLIHSYSKRNGRPRLPSVTPLLDWNFSKNGQWSNPTKGMWWTIGEGKMLKAVSFAQTLPSRHLIVSGDFRLLHQVNGDPKKPIYVRLHSAIASKIDGKTTSFLFWPLPNLVKVAPSVPRSQGRWYWLWRCLISCQVRCRYSNAGKPYIPIKWTLFWEPGSWILESIWLWNSCVNPSGHFSSIIKRGTRQYQLYQLKLRVNSIFASTTLYHVTFLLFQTRTRHRV